MRWRHGRCCRDEGSCCGDTTSSTSPRWRGKEEALRDDGAALRNHQAALPNGETALRDDKAVRDGKAALSLPPTAQPCAQAAESEHFARSWRFSRREPREGGADYRRGGPARAGTAKLRFAKGADSGRSVLENTHHAERLPYSGESERGPPPRLARAASHPQNARPRRRRSPAEAPEGTREAGHPVAEGGEESPSPSSRADSLLSFGAGHLLFVTQGIPICVSSEE